MDDLFTWSEKHAGAAIAAPLQPRCTVPAAGLPSAFRAIVRVLEKRIGQELSITALQIAAAAGLYPDGTDGSRARRIRQLLEVHFDDLPWPLCADATGYYRPIDADELTHYDHNLYGRLHSIALRISTLRKLAKRAGWTYAGHGRWISDTPLPPPA